VLKSQKRPGYCVENDVTESHIKMFAFRTSALSAVVQQCVQKVKSTVHTIRQNCDKDYSYLHQNKLGRAQSKLRGN
jgi:hypothetical protein